MADQKLIDITDLLRQEQQKTTSELITTRHSIQMMSNDIAEGLSFLPSKDESQGMSDIQSIEYSLELANVRDDLRNGFQSVVDAVSGLSGILEKTKQVTIENKGIFLSRLLSRETQEEEERESDQQHAEIIDALGKDGSGEGGEDSKKGGFLKKMLSGIVGFPIKMIKGLFSALGSVGKLFLKFGAFLLKPFAFIGTLGGALTATAALVSGLSAIGALFAGVAITSFMLTDAEFEKLKNKIAKGVAHVFSEIVEGAVNVYNAFMPEKMQVSDEDKKKFKEATFVTLKDSIISIIDFVKGITDSFGAGFLDATKEKRGPGGEVIQESLKTKFNNFTEAFSNLGTSLGEYGRAIAEMFKGFKITVDGTTYEGLMGDDGLFGLMGYLTGKLAGGILDFATAIMNFAADPGKALGKLKGTLSSQIDIIGEELGKVFNEIFSYRSIIRQLESMGMGFLIPESAYKAAATEEVETLEKRTKKSNVNSRKFAELVRQRELELEQIPITDVFGRRDKQASITRAENLRDYFGEEAMDSIRRKQQLKDSQGNIKPMAEKGFTDFDFGMAGIGKGLYDLYDFVLVKPLRDTINAYSRTVKDRQGELGTMREGDTRKSPFEMLYNKLFGGDADMHKGGFISKGGLANVAAGEMMMDNFAAEQSLKAANIIQSYLPQSGATINGLQMDRTMGGTTGSAAPVVIDNSQQPTIINQTNVAAPQTRGPALVGEGRDKVNMR